MVYTQQSSMAYSGPTRPKEFLRFLVRPLSLTVKRAPAAYIPL